MALDCAHPMATQGNPEMPTAVTTPRTLSSVGSGAGIGRERGATAIEELDSIEEIEPDLDSAPPSIPSAATAVHPGTHPAQPVLPGHLIAQRYEVINVLGEGGMGIVYRCRDQATSDLVAVKRVILPEGKLAAEYVGWFYKESRALAALDHPGIVHARDFGQLGDGSPFLAMDLVTGVSLHDLSQSRLSFPIIWAIMDGVLGALAHAHARGVIHGDLKPSNVIVEQRTDEAPRVHILDFGLAWLRQDPHDERLDGEKSMEFAPHAGAGTPGYMAPEQIQHEMHHVQGATDLYALGCILYKLLTGRAPFSGDPKELLKLHAYHQPPQPEVVATAPPGVDKFLLRLLAKRPWDRFEFAAEARRAWLKFVPDNIDPELLKFPSVAPHEEEPRTPTRRTGPRAGGSQTAAPLPDRAPGLLSIRPSPLVGREDIRARLRGVAGEMIAGTGPPHRLVILLGPAGVGKTRVAEWLCEVAHEDGRMVPLLARYRPVRTALDGMLGAVTQYFNFERADRDTIERSLLDRWKIDKNDRKGRSWVAGAAEWLRPMAPGDERVGPSGVRFTLDTLELRRLVIQYTIRRIADTRPLLFFFDDLHHAAATTFDGLLKIHREEQDQRILMLVCVRSEDVHLGTPAAERLRHLRETMDGEVIEVNPMDRETTCALVRASLPLDEEATNEAARRSRGFPLFALQQLHSWAHGGNLEFRGGTYRVPRDVLAVRPKTTADLWDSRVAAVARQLRIAAYAVATLGTDIRRDVMVALLSDLKLPAEEAIAELQKAEILLPRGPGRYGWPHQLLQEHLFGRLSEREDSPRMFKASAKALRLHPLANTRRIVRQRVINLLYAGENDAAAETFFDFLQSSWNGAREPAPTLADLELFQGRLQGRSLALENRWRAEVLRHVGRIDEATQCAQTARERFERIGDQENLAHCLRLLGHLASEQGETSEGLRLVGYAHQIFNRQGNVLGLAQCEAVAAWIEYLLGNHDRAREIAREGERHFASLDQPLGRGQCLLVLSWVDHHEGATERSKRLTTEARGEFERAGYRLGLAQTDASLAHIEHRLMNYSAAEQRAKEASSLFEGLRTPRGQAECERLLAMVGVDTDDLDTAEIHADRALDIYTKMSDPWGVVEAKLLLCQIALGRGRLEIARSLLSEIHRASVKEPEPKQHSLLTEAWLAAETGDAESAYAALDAAASVFNDQSRVGDHTPHLLGRLSRFHFPARIQARLDSWREIVNDKGRREQA
jgi:serine/threonine protein kinase/tetratricopeptide (TPR) repeat protein